MAKVHFIYQAKNYEGELFQQGKNFHLSLKEAQLKGEILFWEAPRFKIKLEDKVMGGLFYRGPHFVDIHFSGTNLRIQFPKKLRRGNLNELLQGEILAPMPGKILKLFVKEGDLVAAGYCLMVIEAMKMEHKILSPCKGQVEKLFFKENHRVSQGDELIKIKEE